MEDARKTMLDRFATALYTAQTGKAPESLVDACDDGSNVSTYGNIDRSTYTWWQGYYNGTGGDLSLSMMATAYRGVKSGNDKPTLIVTDEATWDLYEALLQPQQRYVNNPKNVDAKFPALYYGGTPIVADEYCTSGYMYFLNEKYLKFIVANRVGDNIGTDKMGFGVGKFHEPTDQDGKVSRHIAHYKSALINLGKSVHTILTKALEFVIMVLYDNPQQVFKKFKTAAETERAEFGDFIFGQATVRSA